MPLGGIDLDITKLERLLAEYRVAPPEFQATSYWEAYEAELIEVVRSLDVQQLRAGRHQILGAFGFWDSRYFYEYTRSFWKNAVLKFVHRYIIRDRDVLPYQMRPADIQELAFRHCELLGELCDARPLESVEVSLFGNPEDTFTIRNRTYTMSFLDFYIRYCFAHRHIAFEGSEIVVELGSGSGYQVELLKKLYPEMTFLCFDLPAQLFLCETYLSEALGAENVVGVDVTREWTDLSMVEKGGVHFFGSWQFPLISDFPFDAFWNAASFGEMEPAVVENYLSFVRGNAKWIYLQQARHGKEMSGSKNVVLTPIVFDDYDRMLKGYRLQQERDAWWARRRRWETMGYFEGVWRLARDADEAAALSDQTASTPSTID